MYHLDDVLYIYVFMDVLPIAGGAVGGVYVVVILLIIVVVIVFVVCMR